MVDITTFYGYKTQFIFAVENNGQNPIEISDITLVNRDDVISHGLYEELENTLPIALTGNSDLDILTNQYSLNTSDLTHDLTYLITYDIVDMTDLTTVIDTTTLDFTFELVNNSVTDPDQYSYISKINKHYKLGPNSLTDTTIRSTSFTTTGLPIIIFTNKLEFHIFLMRYSPQFVVLRSNPNNVNVITGSFYYNNSKNSIEAYFTENEKTSITGMTFDTIYLFYTET